MFSKRNKDLTFDAWMKWWLSFRPLCPFTFRKVFSYRQPPDKPLPHAIHHPPKQNNYQLLPSPIHVLTHQQTPYKMYIF